jgi:hypothetical protein
MLPGSALLAVVALTLSVPMPVYVPGPWRDDGNERTSSLAGGCTVQPPDPAEPERRITLCSGHAGWRIERRSSRDDDALILHAADGRRIPLDIGGMLGGPVRVARPRVDWVGLGRHGAPPRHAPSVAMLFERGFGLHGRRVGIVVRLEGRGAPCIVAAVYDGAEMPGRLRQALMDGWNSACVA